MDPRASVSTPIASSFGPYTVEDSLVRKTEKSFYFNQPTIPAASGSFSGSDAISTSIESSRVNEFGLFDYILVMTTEKGQAGCSYTLYGPVFTEVSQSTTYDVADKEKTIQTTYTRYKWQYDYSIRFHGSLSEAVAAITQGEDGSSYSEAGGGMWKSSKVVTTKVYVNVSSATETYPWQPPS